MTSHLASTKRGNKTQGPISGEGGPCLFLQPGPNGKISAPIPSGDEVCMANDPIIIYPKWQIPLAAALAETYPTYPHKLLERVKEAQKAIAKRFEKISRSTSHAAELEAIEKAMDTLDVLSKAIQPKAS